VKPNLKFQLFGGL